MHPPPFQVYIYQAIRNVKSLIDVGNIIENTKHIVYNQIEYIQVGIIYREYTFVGFKDYLERIRSFHFSSYGKQIFVKGYNNE